MSFQQGLSGLSAAAKSLEAIGNNISNANTVGFKSAAIQFSSLYSNSGFASNNDVGIGVKVGGVSTLFSQGNATITNNPLDMAIGGNGFFVMNDNGLSTYGRNGQFHVDKNGAIVSTSGSRLQGYVPDANGIIDRSILKDLVISNNAFPPKATSKITSQVNLDSRAPVKANASFDLTDPSTYTHSTSISTYDSLGNSHVLSSYYLKSGSNQWDVFAAIDGVKISGSGSNGTVGSLNFNQDGTLNQLTSTSPILINQPVGGGAITPLVTSIDPSGTSQFGSAFAVLSSDQNGFAASALADYTITQDGTLTGRYSNGRTYQMGQVALADFKDRSGLEPLGNSAWAATVASGQPTVSQPGTSSLGTIQSGSVEDSNVDLTAELVNMITAQRQYQANTNTIKTQDQVLQTLLNLR